MPRKILDKIDKAIGVVLVIMFAIMVSVIFFQVIMRALGRATVWSEELATFANVWMCSLGAALAFRRYKHISINVVADLIPWKIRRYIDIAGYVLIIVFLAVAAWESFDLIQRQWNVFTTGFRMRKGLLFCSVPISAVLMIASLIECIYDKIKSFNVNPADQKPKKSDK